MALDYQQYTTQPQFNSKQSSQVRRIKKFLGNEHKHSSKERQREKLKELYQQRRKARAGYEKPTYGDGSMSGSQVDQQIVSGVRSKYGNEIDASPARQQEIKGYYDSWNQELQAIKTNQAQQAQSQMDAATQAQQQISGDEKNANSALLSQMQSDAASRGATVDPSLFVKANQASANRAQMQNTQTTTMGALKNVNDNYYANQGLINRAQKQGSLDKERSYTSRLRSDAADYATGMRRELDQASFDRAITKKTLGLKESDQIFQQGMATAEFNQGSSSGSGGGGSSSDSGGLTPAQQRDARQKVKDAQKEYRKVRGMALSALTTKDDKGKPILSGGGAPAAEYINYLVTEKGIDPLVAQAAVLDALQQQGKSKRRDPQLAKKIHKAYGYKIHIG